MRKLIWAILSWKAFETPRSMEMRRYEILTVNCKSICLFASKHTLNYPPPLLPGFEFRFRCEYQKNFPKSGSKGTSFAKYSQFLWKAGKGDLLYACKAYIGRGFTENDEHISFHLQAFTFFYTGRTLGKRWTGRWSCSSVKKQMHVAYAVVKSRPNSADFKNLEIFWHKKRGKCTNISVTESTTKQILKSEHSLYSTYSIGIVKSTGEDEDTQSRACLTGLL